MGAKMNCAWCGEQVRHSWVHVECTIKDIITHHADTSLYECARTMYPDVFKRAEEELKHAK